MLDPNDPGRVVAVLDWELSTLGDPLADVGLLGVYWGSPDVRRLAGGRQPDHLTGDERAAASLRAKRSSPATPQRSGRDLAALPWYLAFGYFKLAVIATGIAARHQAGGMIGEGFDTAAASVPPLVTSGRQILAGGCAHSRASRACRAGSGGRAESPPARSERRQGPRATSRAAPTARAPGAGGSLRPAATQPLVLGVDVAHLQPEPDPW